jgi:hypothetical protein
MGTDACTNYPRHVHTRSSACPAGYFCPSGTASGTANGTDDASHCNVFFSWYECLTLGNGGVDSECPAGFFCPSGTASGTANGTFEMPSNTLAQYWQTDPFWLCSVSGWLLLSCWLVRGQRQPYVVPQAGG